MSRPATLEFPVQFSGSNTKKLLTVCITMGRDSVSLSFTQECSDLEKSLPSSLAACKAAVQRTPTSVTMLLVQELMHLLCMVSSGGGHKYPTNTRHPKVVLFKISELQAKVK